MPRHSRLPDEERQRLQSWLDTGDYVRGCLILVCCGTGAVAWLVIHWCF